LKKGGKKKEKKGRWGQDCPSKTISNYMAVVTSVERGFLKMQI